MSTTSLETDRTDNEDALWQALNARPLATTAELAAAAGIGTSSARKILARWAEDSSITRHTDDPNTPHRWTVTTTDTATSPIPDTTAADTAAVAPESPAAPAADPVTLDGDAPAAEPATAPTAPPADSPAEPASVPDTPGDTTPDDTDSAAPPDGTISESPFGAPCPIAVGDEVANRYHRSWRGRVTEMQCQDGIAQCIIETSDGAQSSIPPWALVPAGPDAAPDEWQQQMDTLIATQHDRAVHQLQDRYTATREHLEHLARRLTDIATALGAGTAPHGDDTEPIACPARELDDALVELSDFRNLVTESGLLTGDEIRRATTRPTTRPSGTRPAGTVSNPSTADKLPPGGLRGMVEDALHDNPGRTFTTTELKRVLDDEHKRAFSSGAISNALDKLTEQGVARRVNDYPRTWALAENS